MASFASLAMLGRLREAGRNLDPTQTRRRRGKRTVTGGAVWVGWGSLGGVGLLGFAKSLGRGRLAPTVSRSWGELFAGWAGALHAGPGELAACQLVARCDLASLSRWKGAASADGFPLAGRALCGLGWRPTRWARRAGRVPTSGTLRLSFAKSLLKLQGF